MQLTALASAVCGAYLRVCASRAAGLSCAPIERACTGIGEPWLAAVFALLHDIVNKLRLWRAGLRLSASTS